MLTRRARGRVFLLRPDERLTRLIKYVLAVVSAERQVQLHAVCVMSNHWHVTLTDPRGNIVDFQRDCHQFIARALNANHGEFEAVWASAPGSRVECEQPVDTVKRIAYTMANPVESGLVRHGHDWPGLRRAWPRRPETIKKPMKFFRGIDDGGDWPDTAELVMTRPPGFEELTDDELADLLTEAIEKRELKFRKKHDKARRDFPGRRAVLRQSRHERPTTRETRFGISPKVACVDKWRRIERLGANKAWLAKYRAALTAWRSGIRDVVFPEGTYLMRVRHGVSVACARGPD